MKIVYGDLFAEMHKHDAVGVPTNGDTNSSGLAIMGAGVAKAAVSTLGPWIREFLGAKIDRYGSHVHVVDAIDKEGSPIRRPRSIFSFPTKHHWHDKKSDLALIETSADELVATIREHGWKSVCMPEPGTGMGGLTWEQVAPLLMERFGDELTIIRLPS